MLTQPNTSSPGRGMVRGALPSAALHLLVVGMVLYGGWQPARLKPMNASLGAATHLAAMTNGAGEAPESIAETYTPPRSREKEQVKAVKVERDEKKIAAPPAPDPAPAMAPQHTSSPVLAAETKQGGASDFGSSGTDFSTLRVALPDNAPRPKVDISALPPGKEGDVVLDATIDAQGKVRELQLVSTMGYGIEESVMQTVRGWTFKPATRDGIPIAIVQELHFHYGPRV